MNSQPIKTLKRRYNNVLVRESTESVIQHHEKRRSNSNAELGKYFKSTVDSVQSSFSKNSVPQRAYATNDESNNLKTKNQQLQLMLTEKDREIQNLRNQVQKLKRQVSDLQVEWEASKKNQNSNLAKSVNPSCFRKLVSPKSQPRVKFTLHEIKSEKELKYGGASRLKKRKNQRVKQLKFMQMERFEYEAGSIHLSSVNVSAIEPDQCPNSPLMETRSILKPKNLWNSQEYSDQSFNEFINSSALNPFSLSQSTDNLMLNSSSSCGFSTMKRRFLDRARDRNMSRCSITSRSPRSSQKFKLEAQKLFEGDPAIEEIINKAPSEIEETPMKPNLDTENDENLLTCSPELDWIDPKHAFSPLKIPTTQNSLEYNTLQAKYYCLKNQFKHARDTSAIQMDELQDRLKLVRKAYQNAKSNSLQYGNRTGKKDKTNQIEEFQNTISTLEQQIGEYRPIFKQMLEDLGNFKKNVDPSENSDTLQKEFETNANFIIEKETAYKQKIEELKQKKNLQDESSSILKALGDLRLRVETAEAENVELKRKITL